MMKPHIPMNSGVRKCAMLGFGLESRTARAWMHMLLLACMLYAFRTYNACRSSLLAAAMWSRTNGSGVSQVLHQGVYTDSA